MKPDMKNQIKLKNGYPIIDFKISNIEIKTLNILNKKVYEYFSNKPMLENIKKFNQKNLIIEDASHHMGGLVYPKIVVQNLKFKGLKNIFCCSSSIFPTSGSVNPTMTTCALAL